MPVPRASIAALLALLLSGCGGGSSSGPDGSGTLCTPSETRACYTGSPATLDVGACHGGLQTCAADGSAWGGCTGEQLPAAELCGDGIDGDCNGAADDTLDEDGDGWSRCDGDCCDSVADGCASPALVNPGAFDVAGNGVDDDCSGGVDDAPPATCAPVAKLAGVTAADLAAALDLCQATTAAPPLAQKRWGLLSATLTLSDGTGAPVGAQVGVLADFGVNAPRQNVTFAALSSGTARDAADPGFGSPFNLPLDTGQSASAPSDYLAANGGVLPHGACPAALSTVVNDPVQLRLQIRVPTNAQGFRFWFRYFSSDYPAFACSEYNDSFVALLDSGAAGIPADKNLSFDAGGAPISVNNGFFTTCTAGSFTCPDGDAELDGTGYHFKLDAGSPWEGGATSWLQTSAPVVAGEVVTLRFDLWDTGDPYSDSLVLLDGFEWLFAPTTVGTAAP